MDGETVLTLHCKASDYDASTAQCAYPFYGPTSSFPPPLSVADSLVISAGIVGCWSVGFMIRQSRRVAGG